MRSLCNRGGFATTSGSLIPPLGRADGYACWTLSPTSIELALLAFCAAIVNGAVGYGFSSIVTPIALFWTTNRILNPALVLVELCVNVTLLLPGTAAHPLDPPAHDRR